MSTAAGTERRTLGIRVLTPEGPVFDGVAQMVIIPSVAGEVGILARHAPFIAQLRVGDVRIDQPDGTVVVYATTEGYSAVEADHPPVPLDQAELFEEIDLSRAHAAPPRARPRRRPPPGRAGRRHRRARRRGRSGKSWGLQRAMAPRRQSSKSGGFARHWRRRLPRSSARPSCAA